jgi:hypothetical protein
MLVIVLSKAAPFQELLFLSQMGSQIKNRLPWTYLRKMTQIGPIIHLLVFSKSQMEGYLVFYVSMGVR